MFTAFSISQDQSAVQFISIDRINSILVVSGAARVFDEVESLDQEAGQIGDGRRRPKLRLPGAVRLCPRPRRNPAVAVRLRRRLRRRRLRRRLWRRRLWRRLRWRRLRWGGGYGGGYGGGMGGGFGLGGIGGRGGMPRRLWRRPWGRLWRRGLWRRRGRRVYSPSRIFDRRSRRGCRSRRYAG